MGSNDLAEAKALAKKLGATMSREEVANALGLSLDVLDRLHKRGEGPPRFRVTPHRWCYPLPEFRRWQEQRLAEAEAH